MTYKKPFSIVNKSENNNSPSNHVNILSKNFFVLLQNVILKSGVL